MSVSTHPSPSGIRAAKRGEVGGGTGRGKAMSFLVTQTCQGLEEGGSLLWQGGSLRLGEWEGQKPRARLGSSRN